MGMRCPSFSARAEVPVSVLPAIVFIHLQQDGDISHAYPAASVRGLGIAEEEEMREIAVTRSESDGTVNLELNFKILDQLLDSSDPSPLPERELTEQAEETIAGYVDEFIVKRPVELTISLPWGAGTSDLLARIPDTIRRHFTFRLNDLDHEKRLSLSEGEISLGIAVFNGIVAILFVFYLNLDFENPVVLLLGGLITILNWVTVWHTYEYFMYEYRQLRRKRRIYNKIAGMTIQVRVRDTESGAP
jgi:hypothetical protein